MSKSVNLIFPHQLFAESELLVNGNEVYLIEEYLFFRQYHFHKQKLAFHRASMKCYEAKMTAKGITVHYIDSNHELSDIRNFKKEIESQSITELHAIDPTDDWLEQRLNSLGSKCTLKLLNNPQFFNSREDLSTFFRRDKKSYFQTTFYKQQRKKHGILMDPDGQPEGGQWTFDADNRKKYPKAKTPPAVHFPGESSFWNEALAYVEQNFSDHPGSINKQRIYPISEKETKEWLNQFLNFRFYDFGIYEDAIVKEEIILNHSLLSPLMNVGLILPNEVIDQSVKFANTEGIPINSLEGFVRQIMGWREFIRGMYECKGSFSRSCNFWNFKRKIPPSFYNGTTGITPIDQSIKKVLKTGYCHHIERLMVLGNFMLLCEFDPDEVFKWFMELFIDAYDWVMVPNVYGMCLFADGGTFATKPYIGGSNYLKKMSNYGKGDWEDTWDALFWRFVIEHQGFFRSNPRTSMLGHHLNKMNQEKMNEYIQRAELFLAGLDSE